MAGVICVLLVPGLWVEEVVVVVVVVVVVRALWWGEGDGQAEGIFLSMLALFRVLY